MIKAFFLFPILLYKTLISPFLPSRCRFYPSCSEYAYESIKSFGVVRGLFLGAVRLLKCHPFHPGGVDLVPDTSTKKQKNRLDPHYG